MTVDDLIAIYRRYLQLDDPGAVWITLATYIANCRPGTPLWLLVVAPPSSGKTECLLPLAGAPSVKFISTLTSEGALLSATEEKERAKNATGGLLREIGTFGIVVLKDFGSILSMNSNARAPVMAALREVFDGEWTRATGAEGGKKYTWTGKLGLIGACTPVIDRHHAVMSALGDRFLLYRPDPPAANLMCSRALDRDGGESAMRTDLAAAVHELLAPLDLSANPAHLSELEKASLTGWATLVARGRAAVERDGCRREIELVPGAEGPSRLVIQFRQLLDGLRTLGADESLAWALVGRVALDTIPFRRRRLLEFLRNSTDALDTTALSLLIGHPPNTTRRDLEDLTAYGMVQRDPGGQGKSDSWKLDPRTREDWAVAERHTSPEISETAENTAPEMLVGVGTTSPEMLGGTGTTSPEMLEDGITLSKRPYTNISEKVLPVPQRIADETPSDPREARGDRGQRSGPRGELAGFPRAAANPTADADSNESGTHSPSPGGPKPPSRRARRRGRRRRPTGQIGSTAGRDHEDP